MAKGVYYDYYFVNETHETVFYDEMEVEEFIRETYESNYYEDYIDEFMEINETEYNLYILEGYTIYECR